MYRENRIRETSIAPYSISNGLQGKERYSFKIWTSCEDKVVAAARKRGITTCKGWAGYDFGKNCWGRLWVDIIKKVDPKAHYDRDIVKANVAGWSSKVFWCYKGGSVENWKGLKLCSKCWVVSGSEWVCWLGFQILKSYDCHRNKVNVQLEVLWNCVGQPIIVSEIFGAVEKEAEVVVKRKCEDRHD